MRDNNNDDDRFKPPKASSGVRTFAARSKSSARGFGVFKFPAEDRPRQVIHESWLERGTLLCLYARNDVWNIHDQPAFIQYFSESGSQAQHVPDYLVEFRSGRKTAIAVKPHDRAQKTRFRETLLAVRKSLSLNFADRLVLVTERNLHPVELRNAEFLYFCRQVEDAEADQSLDDLRPSLPAKTSIAEIVEKLAIGGRGFRAVFRAIYDDKFVADKREVIDYSTTISPAAQT